MIRKTLTLAAAILISQATLSHAREIFYMKWRGIAYTTDGSGRIVKHHYNQKDIIREAAEDNGIYDLKALAYVYVADENNTEVVWKDTGETVREIFQFEYDFTDLTNPDGDEGVMHAFIFDEAHSSAIGTIFARHKTRYKKGVLKKYKFRGSFQFALSASDTQNTFPYSGEDTVIKGTFSTGKRLDDGSY